MPLPPAPTKRAALLTSSAFDVPAKGISKNRRKNSDIPAHDETVAELPLQQVETRKPTRPAPARVATSTPQPALRIVTDPRAVEPTPAARPASDSVATLPTGSRRRKSSGQPEARQADAHFAVGRRANGKAGHRRTGRQLRGRGQARDARLCAGKGRAFDAEPNRAAADAKVVVTDAVGAQGRAGLVADPAQRVAIDDVPLGRQHEGEAARAVGAARLLPRSIRFARRRACARQSRRRERHGHADDSGDDRLQTQHSDPRHHRAPRSRCCSRPSIAYGGRVDRCKAGG